MTEKPLFAEVLEESGLVPAVGDITSYCPIVMTQPQSPDIFVLRFYPRWQKWIVAVKQPAIFDPMAAVCWHHKIMDDSESALEACPGLDEDMPWIE